MGDTNGDLVEILNDGSIKRRWSPIIGESAQFLPEALNCLYEFPKTAGQKVVEEATMILASCKPPLNTDSPLTGLVCGRVQSGKTASMTAVSALAKDNGYRIVIVLTGVTTNLLDQNSTRLIDSLRAGRFDLSWKVLINPSLLKEDELMNQIAEWMSDRIPSEDKRTLLVLLMKNHVHIRNLVKLLSRFDLTNIPSIIIDDEADQASMNTKPLTPNPSAVYSAIIDLRKVLPNHSYLQYTATPQAPLLIAKIDSLSADFAELVSPGENYIGGEKYFCNNNLHVKRIPPSDFINDKSLPLYPPESLIEALRVFYIGVADGKIRDLPKKRRSMLVHPSKRTATHEHFSRWIHDLQTHWQMVFLSSTNDERKMLIDEFYKEYLNLNRTESNISSFEDILLKLPTAIGQTAITIVNSTNGEEIDWDSGYAHILIGGEKLARGYTIKGLTVTYMSRDAGGWTADTIQQRARFYGYHASYFGLTRLYIHPDIALAFSAYLKHEEDIRTRLNEFKGKDLKNWPRIFYLDHHLSPTRKNVLSNELIRKDYSKSWFAPRAPHNSKNNCDSNRSLISNIPTKEFEPDLKFQQHLVALFNLEEVFQNLLVPWSYIHEDDALGLCIVNCNIATYLEKGSKIPCQIVIMDKGQTRQRTLSNGCIPELFQGRSSAGAGHYPGDQKVYNPSMVTIQIHNLKLKEGKILADNIPAIAIRLPVMEDTVAQKQ